MSVAGALQRLGAVGRGKPPSPFLEGPSPFESLRCKGLVVRRYRVLAVSLGASFPPCREFQIQSGVLIPSVLVRKVFATGMTSNTPDSVAVPRSGDADVQYSVLGRTFHEVKA